jgi:hypothetical protein
MTQIMLKVEHKCIYIQLLKVEYELHLLSFYERYIRVWYHLLPYFNK